MGAAGRTGPGPGGENREGTPCLGGFRVFATSNPVIERYPFCECFLPCSKHPVGIVSISLSRLIDMLVTFPCCSMPCQNGLDRSKQQ